MVLIKDVQTALARPPTETDTSAVVTGPVLSSAKAESGQRFKIVAGLLAAVLARGEPDARMRTGCVLTMGLQWYFGQSPTGTMEAAWNDSTSSNLLAVFRNSAQY